MHQHNIKCNFLQHHSIPILLVRSIPLGCMLALLLLASNIFLIPSCDNKAYAEEVDDTNANSGISTLAATASLTLANPAASTSLNTTVEPGGVGYVSANVTYSASNIGDYAVRISLAEGKSNPKNGTTTLSGANGATTANMANNTWGYAWSTDTSADQTTQTYKTVPVFGSPADVISKTNVTDSVDATGKIMFAAKFAENAPTGHYATSVLLSMVATPKTTYTLTYNANGGSNAPTNQTTSTTSSSQSYTIPTDTKSILSGRTFLGWATTNNAYYPEYYPGASITLTPDNASKTLCAVWDGTSTTFPSTLTTMQGMTSSICAGVKVGANKTLTDSRDSSTYTVARLSDGKCWMTQNLRLAGGTVLNRTNTDLDSGIYTTDAQTYTLPAATTGGFSNAMLADGTGTEAYMNHQVRNSTDNDYGAYYSWCAATAGTCQIGTYANIQPDTAQTGNQTTSPANTTAVPANSQATSSICPKGWRLPTSGSTGDFQALCKNYPNATPSAFQTNNSKNGYWLGGDGVTNGGTFFYAAGYMDINSSPSSVGLNGHYWSSVAGGTTFAYTLGFDSIDIYPSLSDYKCNGFSVRCVAR